MGDLSARPLVRTARSADGTLIAYEISGTGPAVVLVDGAGCHRRLGPSASLARALAADLTAVVYDRRGRGDSTNTLPYDIAREVEDLEAVIRALGRPVALYGYSSGAVLALHAAAFRLPISRLALLEPPLDLVGGPPPVSSLEVEVRELIASGRPADAVEHFQRSIGVPEDVLRSQRAAPYWPSMQRLAPTLLYDLAVSRSLTADVLYTIDVPTLVIESNASPADLRAWAREVSEALPRAQLRTLAGVWHGIPESTLARELRTFLVGWPLTYS